MTTMPVICVYYALSACFVQPVHFDAFELDCSLSGLCTLNTLKISSFISNLQKLVYVFIVYLFEVFSTNFCFLFCCVFFCNIK